MERDHARLHGRGRDSAPRIPSHRAHARPPRRREALAAAGGGGLRARARRAHRRPGRADGQGRPEGDLPLRLAGRSGREPGRRCLSGSEPVSGEQCPGDGAPAEQRASARRPDRVGRGTRRHRLPAADRRRRRGGLRRPAERVRADEGDDRVGRCGRALRGPALVGEEVRTPRRQGARARPDSSSGRCSPRGWPRT